jgi:hypothetical protein
VVLDLFTNQVWLTNQDAFLMLAGDVEPSAVYVVHVDKTGITYEEDGTRAFSPWASVLHVYVQV